MEVRLRKERYYKEKQEGKMSAAGHGGLSSRALSRTHAGMPITRNGAKIFKSLRIVCQTKIGTKA